MNSFTAGKSIFQRPDPDSGPPVRLAGASFAGWALGPHLALVQTPSGASTTMRTEFAEEMYRFRYQGERTLLRPLAERFARAVDTLFSARSAGFGCIAMVPAPLSRPDYPAVIELVSELSRMTGIVSAQHAVKKNLAHDDAPPYAFSSEQTKYCFAEKNVLVLDDIYRSGRSLHAFCRFIKENGNAATVSALVGTIVR